jgi:response regulator RpfG family c-di-GMP phosphodiesterase
MQEATAMPSRLMIIDDSIEQIRLMEAIFSMVAPSIEIQSSLDGDEALETLRMNPTDRPVVILLDLRMPKRDGIEILRELKADPELRTIPVCMFSNGDVESDIRHSYEGHASTYIKKPTGIDDLKHFAECFSSIWFRFARHCD